MSALSDRNLAYEFSDTILEDKTHGPFLRLLICDGIASSQIILCFSQLICVFHEMVESDYSSCCTLERHLMGKLA